MCILCKILYLTHGAMIELLFGHLSEKVWAPLSWKMLKRKLKLCGRHPTHMENMDLCLNTLLNSLYVYYKASLLYIYVLC